MVEDKDVAQFVVECMGMGTRSALQNFLIRYHASLICDLGADAVAIQMPIERTTEWEPDEDTEWN